MSDKSILKKFIHDLSNKIMILEGYLTMLKIKPEFDIKLMISKLEDNIVSVVQILENMRGYVKQESDETALISLVYSSKVKEYMTGLTLESELEKIELSSATNNTHINVTGYLLYMDGYFIQYLEGSPKDVEKLYLKISLDPRHHSITLLSHEKITERSFNMWTKLYRMNLNNHSQITDILKSIVGEKQRLLSKTESLALINFIALIDKNNPPNFEGRNTV
jgi:hypothetical protein